MNQIDRQIIFFGRFVCFAFSMGVLKEIYYFHWIKFVRASVTSPLAFSTNTWAYVFVCVIAVCSVFFIHWANEWSLENHSVCEFNTITSVAAAKKSSSKFWIHIRPITLVEKLKNVWWFPCTWIHITSVVNQPILNELFCCDERKQISDFWIQINGGAKRPNNFRFIFAC